MLKLVSLLPLLTRMSAISKCGPLQWAVSFGVGFLFYLKALSILLLACFSFGRVFYNT